MLLTICSCNRKRYLLLATSLDDFVGKAKQLLGLQGDFRCVLEHDGTEILNEVLEAILEAKEKIGVIMILRDGEQWSRPEEAPHQADCSEPSLPTLRDTSFNQDSPARPQHGAAASPMFYDVRAVLEKNPKGQKVLAEYDRHKTLSSESRQALVKVVVSQLVHDCGPYPTKENKSKLGSSIITAMPGLKDKSGVTGYEHFFSESHGQAGYIQDRLKRVRRSLAPESQQRPRKKSTSSLEIAASKHKDGDCGLPGGDDHESEQELSEAEVDKLRMDCVYANPATDKALILSAMCKTAAARQRWIRSSQPSITEVIEQYPRLEDVPHELLDLDFRLHFPDAVNSFLNEFPKWTPGIITAARLSRKKNVVELLREYDMQQHSAEVTQHDNLFALLCLLHLLPSSNTRQKGRISSVELENSLLTFKPHQTSIDLFLSEKRTDHHKQPFLLCIGSKENPSAYYLILDGKAVCLGECGILRAVDCLFKAHYVYWVGYAKPLALFMEFLQKIVYVIEPTKLSACVRELRNSIVSLNGNNGTSD